MIHLTPNWIFYSIIDCPCYSLFFTCYFQSYFCIYYLHLFTCYMHVHLSLSSYTFTRSSDSLDLHIQICDYLLLIRYLERITCVTSSWSLSFLDYRYSFSFIYVISYFHLYRIQLSFLSFIHLLSLR